MSTLDSLRKEAKRWVKALRSGDPSARQRLRLAYPAAPADPGLRAIQHALAREHGYADWQALKADVVARDTNRTLNEPARTASADGEPRIDNFLQYACWDHHVHGRGDYHAAESAAMRLVTRHPEIATANLYTAVVCGEVAHVRGLVDADPQIAVAKGGPRQWEPLLYLCYARLPLPALAEQSLAIADLLIDAGATPDSYYMAGDAVYSALTGVAGEGEQDAPPHPRRDDLYRLLLERDADPFDIQVLYNTHFRGQVQWWLELTYAHTVKAGLGSAWADPDWRMYDMGGYGSGARFLLWIAIEKNDLALARWVLDHGARPDPAPAPHPRFSKRSVYQDAVKAGWLEIAALLAERGAPVTALDLSEDEAFLAACFRLDRAAVAAALRTHPEYLRSPDALFAAARRDRVDVAALLLDLGMPIEVEDEYHQRALHVAAGSDARRVAALLIERGAEIDPRESRYGGTPMGHASHNDHRAMIDLLAPFSRNVWMLAHAGKVDRLRDVLAIDRAGAREVSPEGVTPLWWLPDDEPTALVVIDLLLTHGANPAQVSKKGTTAADAARRRGLDRAADVLAVAAARWAAPDTRSATALDLAHFDAVASDLATAYARDDAEALARLRAHYGYALTHPDVRANVWRRVRTVREAKGAAAAFGPDEARLIVAHDLGYASWPQLARALGSGRQAPAAFAINSATRTMTLRRGLTDRDWDAAIAVMKEHRIATLEANGRMTDAVMARIAEIEHLTRLELGGSRQLTDEGLQHLRRMPQLQHLDLSEYPGGVITDRGLEPLAALAELRTFLMTWQRGISDAGVAHLQFCDRLEHVNLMGTPTGDGAIAALAGKSQLSHLSTGRLVTDAGLVRLREFPSFTTPQGGTGGASLMAFEDGRTQLLLDGPITDAGLGALADLVALEGLHFFWHVSALTADALSRLRDLRSLYSLGWPGPLTDDVAMRHIAALPTLRKLLAQGPVASDDGFVALSRSQTLEQLWCRECPNLKGRGFVALSELPRLRGLGVSCKQVDDASLAALPSFPALRELVSIDVPDAGFRHIGACSALEHLSCMYCRDTTDAATAHLLGLETLRRYYAGATQITDRSLGMLSTLASLERIELYECLNITDEGLADLARMPRLRELALSGLPGVSRDAVDRLPSWIQVDYNV